jgi:hypothetical protein
VVWVPQYLGMYVVTQIMWFTDFILLFEFAVGVMEVVLSVLKAEIINCTWSAKI